MFDYSRDGVLRSIEFSLERLGVDNIDIIYAHDVDVFTHGSAAAADARIREFMTGGYRALVELREQGTIKAIGAGINEWDIAERLAREGDFDLFLLAGRYTLLEQEALASFLPYCVEKHIGVVIGGPFNSGILATGAKPGAYYNYAPASQEILERVRNIEAVCKSHQIKLAAAALRFPLSHPAIVSVIPGGQKASEVPATPRCCKPRYPPRCGGTSRRWVFCAPTRRPRGRAAKSPSSTPTALAGLARALRASRRAEKSFAVLANLTGAA